VDICTNKTKQRSRDLEHCYLISILEYEKSAGTFIWKVNRKNGSKSGTIAGSPMKTNCGKTYWRITINGMQYLAHRLAWFYINKSWPDDQIDHIDGNGLNNNINNLRSVTGLENHRNKRKLSTNKSGFCGISWNKQCNKWIALIKDNNGKRVYLGLFIDKNDAILARKNAELIYGYHKNHGTNRDL